ncbi:MAG: hypothetical protein IE927_09430, partial [Rhodobacterales bacterium]|nr:hypothetical protein [Rhodobacterales bacterium]
MTALPSAADFTSPTATEGQFKTALNAQRDFLAGLLGVDGTAATALGQLGALMASAVARTTATTLTTTDRGRLFTCTGTWALTLPTVAVAGAGWTVAVANLGTGTITVTPSGGDLVDGAATVALAAGRAALLCATATGWVTLSFGGQVGQTIIPGGTVALPGLAFPGDTNTGLYQPGGDQLAFTTGGAVRLLLTETGAQLTGLLTGTAVTQSQLDTTAGRLMKVGDFGLGVVGGPPLPTDLDDTTLPSGIYRVNATTASGTWPAGVPAGIWAYLFVDRFNTTECRQVMRRVYNETHGWWERIHTSGGGWGAWRQIAPQALVGTCLLYDGVIAGAIIEKGASANGRYTRFMDGTQICTRSNSGVQATDTALTWAAAFIDNSYSVTLTATNDATRF